MRPDLKKTILTHALIIIGFYVVTLLLHTPTILDGMNLSQHDILQADGMSNQIKSFKKETGEVGLWNNYLFSGMPSYFTGINFSGDLLTYAHLFLSLGLSKPFNVIFIAMVGFYSLLLTFKVRPIIAAAGAVAFSLNGFNIIGLMAGHNSKIAAVAYMPLVLAGIKLVFDGRKFLGLGLATLALGLEIKSNHPQITYYLVLITVAFGINELIKALKDKDVKNFAIKTSLIVLASALAVGANFGRLATTLEYSKYSIRGKSELSAAKASSSGLDKEYAFRYSNGIVEPLFLFVPNIFGGSSQEPLSEKSAVAKALRSAGYNRSQIAQQVKSVPTYWGDQPLTAPYYAGTLTFILFILGILILPKKQKIWLVTLVILGIIMSWGKNFEAFNNFLFDYLPGYNKFRSVTFTIIITIFSMNLLGFVALEKLVNTEWKKELKKKIYMLFGIGGGFLIVLLVFSGALGFRGAVDGQLPEWFVNAVREDRQSLLIKDSLRALMFVVAFAVLIWAIFKKKLKMSQAMLGLALLVFIDNFSLSKRFLGKEKFEKDPSGSFFQMTEADQVLASQTASGDRVLNLQNPFNENRTSYHHESIGGYHGAKIRRYQDLIDRCIQNELQSAFQTLQNQSMDFSDLSVLNMLNTKFMYAGAQRNAVFPNRFANGNAWTISEIITVDSPDNEIGSVCSIDTKRQAIIDESKFEVPQISGNGTIVLTEKTPNKVVYSANISGGNALGVFSEIYYAEGWTARINDNEVNILRANYILRALDIPEGQSEIIFEFKPANYYTGNRVMMISSILVFLVFAGGLFVHTKGLKS
ncbi:hypothetical protein [Ekhidna sp.]